ncbi:hypothetical protein PZ897_14320 [Hoeflea sp. YIM 152468]|nr:hypothetical protein [Hoeflea sp. YIM 152468]MDF1609358.1 hypothetical protein [Hoeflea sp. YIM 152468]
MIVEVVAIITVNKQHGLILSASGSFVALGHNVVANILHDGN